MTAAQASPHLSTVDPVQDEHVARLELADAPYAAVRRVACSMADDCLVLRGVVPSYYLKQVAQCLLLRRFGTRWRVENQLTVTFESRFQPRSDACGADPREPSDAHSRMSGHVGFDTQIDRTDQDR